MKKNLICACIAPLLVLGMSFANFKQVNVKQNHSKVIYEDALLQDMTINGTNDLERRDILVNVHLDIEDFSFREIKTGENVDNYKKEKLKAAKKYYMAKNEEIIQQNPSIKVEEMYISTYGPFITYNFEEISYSTHLISELENSKYVDEIIVSYSSVEKENLGRAIEYVRASEYIANSTYTGKGVTIGILEPGIADKKHENLIDTDLTVRDEWYYIETVKEHTTIMASIIAGKYGISPKAKVLSVELAGSAESEIDWLLDNGVDVINLSYGDSNPDGKYSSRSAYMDYIANQYGVMFVASTGNDGGNVCNPGLGYNVLSVGSCLPYEFHSLSGFSSYVVNNGPKKPNLVAPGTNVNVQPYGLQNGTSISAALTTGCIALLMECEPSLKLHPERIIALLSASASTFSNTTFGTFDNESGVGILDIDKAIKNKNNALLEYNTSSNNGLLSSFTINLQKDSKLRIAMAWRAKANGKASGTSFTDYDLKLYNSSNQLIATSTFSDNNVEFIEINITSSGQYKVDINQYGNRVQDDYVAVYCTTN